MMSEPTKRSHYIEAGSPTRCFLPICQKPFESKCFRGEDQRYYCSDVCANEGFDAEATVVPMRKRTSGT
jgi:hypothetical protein